MYSYSLHFLFKLLFYCISSVYSHLFIFSPVQPPSLSNIIIKITILSMSNIHKNTMKEKENDLLLKFEFVEWNKSVYNSLLSLFRIAGPVSMNQNGLIHTITPKPPRWFWQLNSLKYTPLAGLLAPLVDLVLTPEQGQYLAIPVEKDWIQWVNIPG